MTLFQQRRLEVFIAGSTLGMGVWLAAPWDSMDSPAYTVLGYMAPEGLWAWLFLSSGLTHIAWLLVNGRRWWSPMARLASCIFSAFIYASWSAGFAFMDPTTTAVMSYGCLSLGSLACAVTALHDAIYSVRMHYARRAI